MNITERRSAPRFSVSLQGSVTTLKGDNFPVEVSDVSSSGLMFIIDAIAIVDLLPNKSEKNSMKPEIVELNLDLGEENSMYKVTCGVVYIQRKTINVCHVGCRFEAFEDTNGKKLEDYISDLGLPH